MFACLMLHVRQVPSRAIFCAFAPGGDPVPTILIFASLGFTSCTSFQRVGSNFGFNHGTLHLWWLLDLFSRWWLLLILASGLQSRSTVGGSKTKCPFGFRSWFSLISRRVGSLFFFLRSWVPCCSKFQDVSRCNSVTLHEWRDAAVRMSPVALRDFGCLHTAAPAIFSFHFWLSLSPQKQFCKHMFCSPTSACVLVKATADGIFWLKAIQCF